MYVIWDKLDNQLWRGPWTKQECLDWLERTRRVMPRPEGVDEMFEVRAA